MDKKCEWMEMSRRTTYIVVLKQYLPSQFESKYSIYLTQKLGNRAVSNEYSEVGLGSKQAQHALC